MVHPSKADPDQSLAGRLVLAALTVVLQGRNERMPRYRRVILCVKSAIPRVFASLGLRFFNPAPPIPATRMSPLLTLALVPGNDCCGTHQPKAPSDSRLRLNSHAGLAFDVLAFSSRSPSRLPFVFRTPLVDPFAPSRITYVHFTPAYRALSQLELADHRQIKLKPDAAE